MSFTQNLRQTSSECSFLISGSSPTSELNKPNQIFFQALNKKQVQKREENSMVNKHFLNWESWGVYYSKELHEANKYILK